MEYHELLGHVRAFYSDTSRSREETAVMLEELQEEIGTLVESLEDDE